MPADPAIYRTYFLPRLEKDVYLRVVNVKDEKSMIENFADTVAGLLTELGFVGISTPEAINAMLDVLVLAVNGSLTDMHGEAALSMIPHICRMLRLPGSDYSFLPDYLYTKSGRKGSKCGSIGSIAAIPADTRPGFSTSSIWVHSCMTSAIATSVYVSRRAESDKDFDPSRLSEDGNFAILRLAALFHDLGKPVNRKKHSTESVNLLKTKFNTIIDGKIIDKAAKIILEHHSPEPAEALTGRIREADHFASGTDRVTEKIRKAMIDLEPEKYSWVESDSEFNSWDRWQSLSGEEYSQITDRYFETTGITIEQATDPLSVLEKIKPDTGVLAVVLGDARKIQHFIENKRRLDQIKGASARLEGAFLDEEDAEHSIFKLLFNKSVPFENILFSAGGKILLFSHVHSIDDFINELETSFSHHLFDSAELTATYLKFDPGKEVTFEEIMTVLNYLLAVEKSDLQRNKAFPVQLNLTRTCVSCLERPALVNVDDHGVKYQYCRGCADLAEYGKNHAFKRRYESAGGENKTGLAWKDLGLFILEFIAGHSIDEIKLLLEKEQAEHGSVDPGFTLRDLGFIKADGNNMGKFFAASLTPSELVEKSLQTQIALVEAYHKTIDFFKVVAGKQLQKFKKEFPASPVINSGFEELLELQVDLGRMFIGGDDVLLVLPGYLSIPFALKLGEEFYGQMGGPLTGMNLSAGILSTSPKTPFRTCLQNVDQLLASAKVRSRDHAKEGELFFDYEYLFQAISARDLSSSKKTLRENGAIGRPYAVSPSNDPLSNYEMLLRAIGQGKADFEEILADCFRYYLLTCTDQDERAKELLENHPWKITQRIHLDILSRLKIESITLKDDIKLAMAYCAYQKARFSTRQQDEPEIVREIKELAHEYAIRLMWPLFYDKKNSSDSSMLLLDEYIFYKMLGGGRL